MIFQIAAAAILENGGALPVLRYMISAWSTWSVYKISSKLGDKWPNKRTSLIFEMSAAAILENAGTIPVFCFLDSTCFS
jgi:hypothetical protein